MLCGSLRRVGVASLAVLLGTGAALAQTVKGPLPTRDSDPLNTPFLLPVPIDASVLGKGRRQIAANLDIANNLLITSGSENQKYVTDFEEQRLTLDYGMGLGDGQQISLRVPLIDRDGGFLDELINNYHKLFGFKGGGRTDFPNFRTLFQINNAAGQPVVDITRGSSGIGDVVLEYRRSLTPGSDGEAILQGKGKLTPQRLAASVRALVKLPTGDYHALFGSGATDFGIGGEVTVRPGRQLAIHGNLSLVLPGDPRIPHFTPRPDTLVESVVSAEYLLNGGTSLVVQSDDSPAPLRTGIAYADRPRRAFSFGLWRQVSAANRFYVSSSENDFTILAKQAPDFTLSTGFLWGL